MRENGRLDTMGTSMVGASATRPGELERSLPGPRLSVDPDLPVEPLPGRPWSRLAVNVAGGSLLGLLIVSILDVWPPTRYVSRIRHPPHGPGQGVRPAAPVQPHPHQPHPLAQWGPAGVGGDTLVPVVLGGALGAPLRHLADLLVQSRHDSVYPWGTFTVNIVVSPLLGLVAAGVAVAGVPAWVLALVGTGFCGALTLFSTFGFETVGLVEDGSTMEAPLSCALSLVLGLATATAGWALVGLAT